MAVKLVQLIVGVRVGVGFDIVEFSFAFAVIAAQVILGVELVAVVVAVVVTAAEVVLEARGAVSRTGAVETVVGVVGLAAGLGGMGFGGTPGLEIGVSGLFPIEVCLTEL